MPNGDAPNGSRRTTAKYLALVVVTVVLALLFLLLLHSLALPLVFAAIVAVLAHPLQEKPVRGMGGLDWLAAAGLTIAFVSIVAIPPILAVGVAYEDLHGLLKEVGPANPDGNQLSENSPQLRPAIKWVSRTTGTPEDRVREWVRNSGAELEQALYHRSLRMLGNLPGLAIGAAVFFFALFFFLKDGPQLVAAWEDITPLDDRHERLIHREFARVCRGLVWSALAAALAQGVAFGLGLFVLDSIAKTGAGHWIILLSLLTVVCSPIPFLGSASVWASTAAVLFLQGHHTAAVILAIYGGAMVSQVDTVVRVWVLKGIVRMHPLVVFVSILGGIQVLGILGLVVGPVTAAVLFALLRVLRQESTDPSVSKIPEPTTSA